MSSFVNKNIEELQTPALVVYKHIVQRNADNMLKRAEDYGVVLRPHFKTTKCVEAAILQTGGTKRCMAVSTIPEAELLLSSGFGDILYAVPLCASKVARCAKLAESSTTFSVMIDREDIIKQLELTHSAFFKTWNVFVEIDCNNGRSGVPYDGDDVVSIVQTLINSAHINFKGLYAHCGDSYGADNLDHVYQVSQRTTKNVLKLVDKLKVLGIACPAYGIGSTPTCSNPTPIMGDLTEWHPGNYIFYDVMQMRFGSCSQSDIACFVLARVIGHYPHHNHMIIDCGFTGLSLHGGGNCYGKTPGSGYGVIVGHPELKLIQMKQEHGYVRPHHDSAKLDYSLYPVGSFLRILPDHSCATCAMHRLYYIVDENDVVTEEWKPVTGW